MVVRTTRDLEAVLTDLPAFVSFPQALEKMANHWVVAIVRLTVQVVAKTGTPTLAKIIAKVCEFRLLAFPAVGLDQRFAVKNIEPGRTRRLSMPVGRMTQVTPEDEMPGAVVVKTAAAGPASAAGAAGKDGSADVAASSAAAAEPSPSRKRQRKN